MDDFTIIARGRLLPTKLTQFRFLHLLDWILQDQAGTRKDGCNAWPDSVRALVNRIRKFSPAAGVAPRIGLITNEKPGVAQSGSWQPIQLLDAADPWKWLTQKIQEFARLLEAPSAPEHDPSACGQVALQQIVSGLLGSPLPSPAVAAAGQKSELFDLRVTFDQVKDCVEFIWQQAGSTRPVATGRVRCTGTDQLTWELEQGGRHKAEVSSHHRNSIRAFFNRWLKQFPAKRDTMGAFWIQPQPGVKQPISQPEPPFGPDESPYAWVEDNLKAMADALRFQFSPLGKLMGEVEFAPGREDAAFARKLARKEQKQAEEDSRRREAMARLTEARHQKAHLAEAQKGPSAKQSPPLPANPSA